MTLTLQRDVDNRGRIDQRKISNMLGSVRNALSKTRNRVE